MYVFPMPCGPVYETVEKRRKKIGLVHFHTFIRLRQTYRSVQIRAEIPPLQKEKQKMKQSLLLLLTPFLIVPQKKKSAETTFSNKYIMFKSRRIKPLISTNTIESHVKYLP